MKYKSKLFKKASGSIGNITAGGGQGGNTIRFKSMPKDRKTKEQMRFRNISRMAFIAWENATQKQRDEWEIFAESIFITNSTQKTTVLSGWWAFSRAFHTWELLGYRETGIFDVRRLRWLGYKRRINFTLGALLAPDGKSSNIYLYYFPSVFNACIYFVGDITSKSVNKYYGGFTFKGSSYQYYRIGSLIIPINAVSGRVWFRFIFTNRLAVQTSGIIRYVDLPN